MDWQIVLAVIFTYFMLVFVIGAMGSRGQDSTSTEYIAANRSLSLVVMYFLMGGAVFSAFAFLGGPGWAYSKGAAAFYILSYSSLGIIPWWIWGPRTLRAGQRFNYVTQAQLLAGRFRSKTISILVALVSILAFIQYVTVQMKASGYILEVASGGRVPFWLGALVAYVVVISYVFMGGLRSVAWTNVFQGAFMIATAWVLGLYFVFTFYDGPGDMFQKIAEAKPMHLLIGPGTQMSFAAFSSAIIVSMLGFTMWPHLFMKAYTAKDEKTLKQTIVMYPTFSIFLVPVLLIGFAGVLLVSPGELGEPDRILPWMFTNSDFHPIAIGVVLAAALAAAMSTQDTVTHAAGSIFIEDIMNVVLRKKPTEAGARTWIRVSVVCFGFISYVIAIVGGQTLVALLLGAYGSIVQLLPLVAATFFWYGATVAGAISGLVSGITCNYLITFGVIPAFWDIHPGVLGLVVNISVFVIVSLMTKPLDREHAVQYIEI